MFYKLDNGRLVSGETVAAPNYLLTPDDTTQSVDGWKWFDTEAEAQVLFNNLDAKQQLEYDLRAFAAQKDMDIEEVAMLMNSDNAAWVAEATRFQELYLASWEAFYANTPLPQLVW